MTSAISLSEESRRQVRRIVRISRVAGVIVASALGAATFAIHWGNLSSVQFAAAIVSVLAGLMAFMALSTLSRIGHASILERSLREVSQLSEELRTMAERDPLTGLYNHRAFNLALGEAIDDARATRTNVSVIVADLDNFKLLNDAFGHQYGDAVLIDTGAVFADATGDGTVAARLGGDEFAVVLPGASRADAVTAARLLEDRIAALRPERQSTTMGSFGIGTFPADGDTAQALFSAADGRMYSEKHRRKADSLATLAGAARKLFVRAGRAMRPDHGTVRVLQDIADAARDEFALAACVISTPAYERHEAVTAVASANDAVPAIVDIGQWSLAARASLMAALPPDAWLIEIPVPDEHEAGGMLVLAGLPTRSFRPDAPVVVALADLIQAVVANGRAHIAAQRAGRERDVHIDLARALAGEGSLTSRLARVTRMVADAVGAPSVSIEGLPSAGSSRSSYSLMSGASDKFVQDWDVVRSTPESYELTKLLAADAPCIINNISGDARILAAQRDLLDAVGVKAIALAAIRFDGELLGLLGAASFERDSFTEETLAILDTIADHLAPAIKVALLRDELEASFRQLEQASRESLRRLSDAAEARDPHTAGHLRRIAGYSRALALELGLRSVDADAIATASTVHDLGKLSLPDAVLMKPGKLSPADWHLMRGHPAHGERLIGDSPNFDLERAVARWHHERWDGSGYPDGLRGDDIPLAARVVAVADAFDALTTERSYKPAWTVEKAANEILGARGSLYCPAVGGALEALRTSGKLDSLFCEIAADEASGGDQRAKAA